jgi:hypothetical protein
MGLVMVQAPLVAPHFDEGCDRRPMTQRRACPKVVISHSNAEIAARIISDRCEGVNLNDGPLAELHDFERKLRAAIKRRRRSQDLTVWSFSRSEAEAGYRFLMSFSHPDFPADGLTIEEFDAVQDVAIDLAWALTGRSGRPPLGLDQIEVRVNALKSPDSALTNDAVDERFVRRLKKRSEAEKAFWDSKPTRPPLPPQILALLTGRKFPAI